MQIIWYTFSRFIITKNDVKNKLKYYFYSKIEFGIGDWDIISTITWD